MKWIKCSNFQF